MYTLKLSDGSEIKNVDMNWSMFITTSALKREDLSGKLSRIEITGEVEEARTPNYLPGTYTNLKLDYFRDDGKIREFVLNPLTAAELRELAIDAKLDYLALVRRDYQEVLRLRIME